MQVIFGVTILLNTKVMVIEIKHSQLNILTKLKDIFKRHNNKFQKIWKIQLTIANNFTSSIDHNDVQRVMHSRSDNIQIVINDEADEVIKELDSLKILIHLEIGIKII